MCFAQSLINVVKAAGHSFSKGEMDNLDAMTGRPVRCGDGADLALFRANENDDFRSVVP